MSNKDVFAVGARDAFAVTKSDVTSYASDFIDALYIGGAGNVAVVTAGGTTVTFNSAVAGTIIPVQCRQVLDATTATNIVGLRF